MEAIWNRVHLERPPNATCYVEREKLDATALLTFLETVIQDLRSQELLHKEAAILSRLIYRMKSKFRNDKGVKTMSKVNKALLNYLLLSLDKEYENLKGFVEVEGKYIELPTKQMVEYVLVRTQGFAKLVSRVEEVSRLSAHYLRSRIALGHAWGTTIIAYAVVSRIWILSRHLIKKSCAWYNQLYENLKFFKASGLSWLPEGYELPSNLQTWLSLPWIHEPTPSVPSSHGLQSTMFKLIVPRGYDSDEGSENPARYPQKRSVPSDAIPENKSKNNASINDTGEIIDRCSFNLRRIKDKSHTFTDNGKTVPVVTIEEKHKEVIEIEDEGVSVKRDKNIVAKAEKLSRKKPLTFENVKRKSDLVALLSKELYPGLDKLQWNMIRNKSKRLLNKLDAISDETEQLISLERAIKRIQRWIA